jgi:hypothetical protein
MSGITSYSQVPVTVIEYIISNAWLSPLSTADRIILMTSSSLVNREWSNTFNVVSHRDIYVPSTSYFIKKLHPILDGRVKSQPDIRRICRSISMTIEYAAISCIAALPNVALTLPATVSIPGCADEPLMGHTFRALVSTLSEKDYALPNLRTVSVEFVNIGLDDIFVNDRFFRFPAQVTDLEFTFTHSLLVPSSQIQKIRSNQIRHDFNNPTGVSARMDRTLHDGRVNPCFPSVRRLCILGGSEATIADTVSQCPTLVDLELNVAVESQSSVLDTHLVMLRAPITPPEVQGLVPTLTSPKLTIHSCLDTLPDVWDVVHLAGESGVHQFRRPAPALVQRQRRVNRFISRAKKPFSRIFASSSSKRKAASSH